MNCKDLERNLALYPYDELAAEERRACDEHLAGCPACRAKLEEAGRMNALLKARPLPEPTPEMLAQCRTMLEEALDRQLAQITWRRIFADAWASLRTLSPAPVGVALALLACGFSLGWSLRPHLSEKTPVPAVIQNSSVTPWGGSDLGPLSGMRINAITQVARSPSAHGQIRITVDAERRVTLEGSLDDPPIRQVLVDAVKSYSNPGIRRESLDALQSGSHDPSVRDALLFTLVHDPNPGMRLQALQTVRGMKWSPQVRGALLTALKPGNNPGVRVAALKVLVDRADASSLPVLQRLAAHDPDRYVRLQSLNAVRRLQGDF
jgi:HEAT repeats/Putative zinc-finger